MSAAGTATGAAFGWGLAIAAVAAGYISYGWPGVAMAISAVVFWLLLQFSRALRVLREASGNPVGQVPNAVMLHARLQLGMRLPAILKMTRSLGRAVGDAPKGGRESFVWTDAGGDEVRVELLKGQVTAWVLKRAVDQVGA
jgi:hypothetical protein